jgi:hypothetical protein
MDGLTWMTGLAVIVGLTCCDVVTGGRDPTSGAGCAAGFWCPACVCRCLPLPRCRCCCCCCRCRCCCCLAFCVAGLPGADGSAVLLLSPLPVVVPLSWERDRSPFLPFLPLRCRRDLRPRGVASAVVVAVAVVAVEAVAAVPAAAATVAGSASLSAPLIN